MSFNKSIIIIYIFLHIHEIFSLSSYSFSLSSLLFVLCLSPHCASSSPLTSHSVLNEKNVLDFTTSFFLLHSYFIKNLYHNLSLCFSNEFIFKTYIVLVCILQAFFICWLQLRITERTGDSDLRTFLFIFHARHCRAVFCCEMA